MLATILASSLASSQGSLFAVGIVLATVAAIFIAPTLARLAPHVWVPPLAASLAVAIPWLLDVELLGQLRLGAPELLAIVRHNLQIPGLILCLAYLSISLDTSGFFNWCALRILRHSRGDGRLLLINLFIGVSVLTLITSNDIVILAMTPILVHLGANARIHNLTPYLMAQFIAANTASMGLYIGNPTNIVIGSAVGLGFVEYAWRMLLPTIVATATALGVVVVIFNLASRTDRTVATYHVPASADHVTWTREMTVKVTIFAVSLVVLAAVGDPQLLARVGLDVTTMFLLVSAVFAALALAYDLVRDRMINPSTVTPNLRHRIGRLPVEIVPFFLSFCVLLALLERAGVVELTAALIRGGFDHGPVIGGLATGFGGVAGVNLMNNLPATLFFRELWTQTNLLESLGGADHIHARIFVDSSLFASNFGANLTFIGALAGIMWLRISRDLVKDAQVPMQVPTARDFVYYGAIIVPIVTAVTCCFIAYVAMLD
jgi:arsenical pump membrane protein